jgi:hypothetical protein
MSWNKAHSPLSERDKKSLSGESDWLTHRPRLGFLGFWGQKAQMGCRDDKHHARARSLRDC